MEVNQHHWQVVNSGRIVVSNTPETLWADACEYFKWCDENPIKVKKTLSSGKGAGTTATQEHPRPYSVKGLCLHCGITEEYLKDVRATKDERSLYFIVVSKIMYIIYVQNLELATVGVYNPIFTAKVLNMETDDTPTTAITVNVVGGLPALSSTENEVLEKLELEELITKEEKFKKSEKDC
jgi:hypothetical protein